MLEKIINGTKKHGKKAIAIGASIATLCAPANASRLKLEINSIDPITSISTLKIQHHSLGTEEYDSLVDSSFLEAPSNPNGALDIYSSIVFDPYELSTDTRGTSSMTTINGEINGRGFAGIKNAEIVSTIEAVGGENNMLDKKIIAELYEAGADPNTAVKYDVWNMHESGQTIPITINNGLSHKLDVKFYNTNIADFNNDGNVNFQDYAMLAADWNAPTGNYLTDISGPSGISDGEVDIYDLTAFSGEWLS